jgi:hypothetical protein
VLITDHNVRETLHITNRAYILFKGRVLISGTAQELAENRSSAIYGDASGCRGTMEFGLRLLTEANAEARDDAACSRPEAAAGAGARASQHIEPELLTNPLLEVDEEAPEAHPSRRKCRRTRPKEELELAGPRRPGLERVLDDGFEYAEGGRNEREETFPRESAGGQSHVGLARRQLHRWTWTRRRAGRGVPHRLPDDGGFMTSAVSEVAAELGVSEAAVERRWPECRSWSRRASGRATWRVVADPTPSSRARDGLAGKSSLSISKRSSNGSIRRSHAREGHAGGHSRRRPRRSRSSTRDGAQLAVEDARYVVPFGRGKWKGSTSSRSRTAVFRACAWPQYRRS